MTTTKKVLIGILSPLAVIILAIFLVEGLKTPPPPVEVTKECITHKNISALHIHPHLSIIRDGVRDERIPANIGIVSDDCLRPLHTHEKTPEKIHIEYHQRRTFTLGQFFEVWGIPLDDGTKKVTVTVDGDPVADPENHILRDKQEIIITYE